MGILGVLYQINFKSRTCYSVNGFDHILVIKLSGRFRDYVAMAMSYQDLDCYLWIVLDLVCHIDKCTCNPVGKFVRMGRSDFLEH